MSIITSAASSVHFSQYLFTNNFELSGPPTDSITVVHCAIFFLLQKRHFFRVKNTERGHFLSVQGGVEELKSGRVVVTPEVEPLSDIWFYQDGLIKNKVTMLVTSPKTSTQSYISNLDNSFQHNTLCILQLSPTMSLQVVGNIEPAAKLVLWTETRQPVQTWTAQVKGLITSNTFPGMVLDVKGMRRKCGNLTFKHLLRVKLLVAIVVFTGIHFLKLLNIKL